MGHQKCPQSHPSCVCWEISFFMGHLKGRQDSLLPASLLEDYFWPLGDFLHVVWGYICLNTHCGEAVVVGLTNIKANALCKYWISNIRLFFCKWTGKRPREWGGELLPHKIDKALKPGGKGALTCLQDTHLLTRTVSYWYQDGHKQQRGRQNNFLFVTLLGFLFWKLAVLRRLSLSVSFSLSAQSQSNGTTQMNLISVMHQATTFGVISMPKRERESPPKKLNTPPKWNNNNNNIEGRHIWAAFLLSSSCCIHAAPGTLDVLYGKHSQGFSSPVTTELALSNWE